MTPVTQSNSPQLARPPAITASDLRGVKGSQRINEAVGLPLSQADRAVKFNGSLDYKLDTVGISKENLAKAISMAVQSGKVDLNVAPAVFNARTGSQVGSDVLAISKELNIKTDKKSVKQLIAEIGDKTVGSKAGQVMLPTTLLNSLGAVSLAAVASEGEGKLNALGIKASYAFNGGVLEMNLVGNDKTGLKAGVTGRLTASSGNTSATIEGRANTRGGTAAKATVTTGSQDSSASVDASVSSIQGEPKSKFELTGQTTIGKTPVQGSVNVTDSGKGASFGAGVKITPGDFNVTAEFTPRAFEVRVGFSKSF